MRAQKFVRLCGVLLLGLAALGCSKLRARDQLNKGVGAFRNAQFQSAVLHFKNAVALDPTLINARLYLAVAYFQQYVPGGESPENIKIAEQAIEAFQDVLKMDPANETAIASIAQIYYSMKDFEKAKEYQRRRLQVVPNNPEPYYWIGVIDWAVCFRKNGELRKQLQLDVPDSKGVLPPLPERARAQLAKENGELVEEGISALQKAIELKPNDFDTMVYMNLLYRQKADLAEAASERRSLIALADEWQQKALNLRKEAAERAASDLLR